MIVVCRGIQDIGSDLLPILDSQYRHNLFHLLRSGSSVYPLPEQGLLIDTVQTLFSCAPLWAGPALLVLICRLTVFLIPPTKKPSNTPIKDGYGTSDCWITLPKSITTITIFLDGADVSPYNRR